MEKKTFYGRASLIVDFNFEINADNIEDAKQKIFEAYMLDFKLQDEKENDILKDWSTNEWYIVETPQIGNIRQNGISEFEISED